MEKALLRKCPVCGCGNGEILYLTRFALTEENPLARSCDVVTCSICYFGFADTPSTQVDYDLYYRRYSKYEETTTGTFSGVFPADARLSQLAQHIIPFLPSRDARICDIGCGNGGLLLELREHGYKRLTGIDPSSGCVKNMKASGLEAFTGTFSHLPKTDMLFDVITLTGVLEHVLDIPATVEALGELLTPHGRIYIAVPDALRYPDFIEAPFQDFSTEHINHFSALSLTNLMESKSYSTIAAGPIILNPSAGSKTPVAFGVFEPASRQHTPRPDEELRRQLIRYVALSTTFMDKLTEQMELLFARHPRLILWGMGQLASKLLALPFIDFRRIAALADGNPINWGLKLLGKPILAPNEVKEPYPIVIMTTLHQDAIAEAIRSKYHLSNEIIYLRKN